MPTRSTIATFVSTGVHDTLFTLPTHWILMDSVRVLANDSALVEFNQWRIIEPGNRIWLFRPLPAGDTLRVVYSYRPVPLYRIYTRHSLRELDLLGESAAQDSGRITILRSRGESEDAPGWNRLNKSGSLIRSVQIGSNQDLTLESSLNLTVEGRVGKNVDVAVALTDQSTPIQPEGTTESLSELEKVFVTVKSPRLGATIGDFNLDLPGGEFDGYARKLTGVLGEYGDSATTASVSAATSKGQFFSNTFSGQEANQGPYPLRDRDGITGIVVLAGTERVWLDGEAIRRGESNDYTIDYSTGEVTFTARRLITSNSRIVVDFQYANERFERSFFNSRIEEDFGSERFGGAVTFIEEADRRDRPINTTLTAEDKAVLRNAGDNLDSAITFAADSIGPFGGDYTRMDTIVEGTTYTVFVFVARDSTGRPSGEWNIVFDDFGTSQGDYVAAADERGQTYFQWVGLGSGRYRPFRRLPLPARQDLTDLRLRGEPLAGLKVSAESAISLRDLNTFSSLDKQDNDGRAFHSAVDFTRDRINLFGIRPYRLTIRGKLRARDADFVDLNRAQEVEFERDWNLTRNTGYGERIWDGEVRVAPWQALNLSAGFGEIDRSNLQYSARKQFGAGWRLLRDWQTSLAHLELTTSDSMQARTSNWIRQNAGVSGAIWRFSPRFHIERERKRDHTRSGLSGFRFVDYATGSAITISQTLNSDFEYSRRADEFRGADDKFKRNSNSDDVVSRLSWQPPEIGSAGLQYAHREKHFAGGDSTTTVSDVGRLEALIAPRKRFFEGNLTYEVAKSQTQSQILIAIQVDPGTGNYRKEGDQYIPDDQGDYILVPRNTGSYQPATELSLATQISLRPEELNRSQLAAWIRALSTESEITIEERTRLPLSVRMLLLDPTQYRGDSTLTGTIAIRQDLNILRTNRKHSVRLRYRQSQSLQNQYLNGGQTRKMSEVGVRVRALYTKILRGESEFLTAREILGFEHDVAPDREIRRDEFSQRNTLVLSRVLELGLDLRAEEARDERTETQASIREAKPRAAFSFSGRSRFDADFTWTHASSNRSLIPFELASGANRGENRRWSVMGTYAFGRNFSGSISYTGRKDSREETVHTGRVEARASL